MPCADKQPGLWLFAVPSAAHSTKTEQAINMHALRGERLQTLDTDEDIYIC